MNPLVLDDLSALIRRHHKATNTLNTFPRLHLTYSEEPALSYSQLCEPMFALVAQGSSSITLGPRSIECSAGQCVVVPVDLPLTAYVTKADLQRPFLGLGFRLDPAAIAALILESDPARPTVSDFSQGLTVSPLSLELLDPLVRLLRLADRPQDIPILAPAIERELLWRLMTGQQGKVVRQIGLADGRLTRLNRVIRWIRSNFDRTLRISEMAGIADMSVTSFHRHFLRATSLTPLQFQKQIRLQEARMKLLSGALSAEEVCYSVGYSSPSQFSREYRRLFGRAPGAGRQSHKWGAT
ncbi:MAG TPA: AraC family transcriptional regulator [Ideonella sp.]|uniref:AraC family transcriptional regulator n=1 Tax=Ideonella sp. TaxID=1929293 RepID=UPI002BD5A521|nr:AraC family transcriptional regulator [Ideonella sp.]HSI48659.1 AraC family transcriptional regulator [Ideonella sp.]